MVGWAPAAEQLECRLSTQGFERAPAWFGNTVIQLLEPPSFSDLVSTKFALITKIEGVKLGQIAWVRVWVRLGQRMLLLRFGAASGIN